MIELKEINYPPDHADFLARCRQIGVVVDVCTLAFDATGDVYETSKQAALDALRVFSKTRSTPYYPITVDETREPRGQRIGVAEFLGKGFDFERGRVDMFVYNGGSRSSRNSRAFLRALLDPPYGLRLPVETDAPPFSPAYGVEQQAKMTVFLFEFLDKILGVKSLTDFSRYEIHVWSDDWSNYFEAGREWWGCFYWTLLDAENRTATVLGASTTD